MKSKEEIKQDAEILAIALGYNTDSLNLDVINVKDAYCRGYVKGAKEVAMTFLKFAMKNIICDVSSDNNWYYIGEGENEFVSDEKLFNKFLTEHKSV